MTTGAPAVAAIDEGRVVTTADQELAGCRLLLEVALQTEILVAHAQHFRVHRAVRDMARDAAFSQRFVLEDIRPALLRMAPEAGLVQPRELRAAFGPRAALVRVVTVAAAHLAGEYGMTVRQGELATQVGMALETGIRRFARIDDRAGTAARLYVKAARPVTRFAADAFGVVARRHDPRVRGAMEFARDVVVAFLAGLGAHEGRAGDLRRSHDGAIDSHA